MLKKSKQAGTFTVSFGKDVYGELTLGGRNTSLYLQDKDFFDTYAIPSQCVKGILHDFTKVTLLQCITTTGMGSFRRGEQSYNFASIFPHYVVHGDHHIGPAEKKITAVHFVMDDAATLFYDFDAFGSLIDARPFIKQIAHANGLELEREIAQVPTRKFSTSPASVRYSQPTLFWGGYRHRTTQAKILAVPMGCT
jgi:hypothetical protein